MTDYLPVTDYLPHKAPMLFVDRVVYLDSEEVACVTNTNKDGPFKEVLSEIGKLSALYMFEVMAQTVGVWAGQERKKTNERSLSAGNTDAFSEIGMLLSIRAGKLFVDEIPLESELTIRMHKLFHDGPVACFEGVVFINDTIIASGRISAYQPKKSELKNLFEL